MPEKRLAEKKTAPVVEQETVLTAKRTLRAWLIALEDVGLLKPGATARILMNRKLKGIIVPNSALGGS